MELLLGMILSLILLWAMEYRKQQKKPKAPPQLPVRPPMPRGLDYPTRPLPTMPVRPIRPPMPTPLGLQVADDRVSTKTLVQTWRSSITGLVNLAQDNLDYARRCLQTGAYPAALERALTSTENISRALLHCYGEKPEEGSGQGEALRLLALKLTEKERSVLQKTIEESCRIYNIEIVQKYLAKQNIDSSFLLARYRIEPVIESASRVVTELFRFMVEHFATEIPEFAAEICPKCNSLRVAILGFSETIENRSCVRCGHKWANPRDQ